MRFLGSVAAGSSAAARILHLSSVGLDATDIGLLFGAYSVLLGLAEVPSGALADVWGRRRAKVAAAGLLLAAIVAFMFTQGIASGAIALGLLALGRAMDSGAADAWFVDEIGDPDDPAVLEGLASAEAAHNVGTAIGALIGGVIPLIAALVLDGERIFLPVFVVSAVFLLLGLAVTLREMRETAARGPVITGVWATTFVGVRNTLDAPGPRFAWLTMLAVGGFVACTELLTPLGLRDGLGSGSAGLAFGALVASAWGLSAIASLAAPRIESAIGSPGEAGAVLTALTVILVVPMGITAWFTPVISYVGLNLALGALLPLLATVMHRHVNSANRSTAASTLSLGIMAGAAVGSWLVAAIENLAVLPVASLAMVAALGLFRHSPASRPPRSNV